MRLNDAVHAVTGEIFRDGWSRVRGSMQGLHVAKQTQLMVVLLSEPRERLCFSRQLSLLTEAARLGSGGAQLSLF